MSTCDDTTLAHLELPRVDHRERELALIYNRPPFFATCDPFTKVARISYRKFDQGALRSVNISTIRPSLPRRS